jgi:hypothetical protein
LKGCDVEFTSGSYFSAVAEYDIGEQVLPASWFVDNVHTYSILNQIFRPIQRFPQSLKSVGIIAFAFFLDGGVSEAAYRGAQTFDRFVANPEGFRQGMFQSFALGIEGPLSRRRNRNVSGVGKNQAESLQDIPSAQPALL